MLLGRAGTSEEELEILLWDIHSGQPPRVLRSGLPPLQKGAQRGSFLLADNRTVLITDEAHITDDTPAKCQLWFWDVMKKKLLFQVQSTSSEVNSTANGLCTLRNMEGYVEVWNYHTGQRLRTLYETVAEEKVRALSPDGSLLACENGNAFIFLRDGKTGRTVRTLDAHGGGILDLCFSPDGRTLASSSNDGTVKLWRIK